MGIKNLRLERNWSQAELAKKAGLSQSYIHDLETGTKTPTIRTLEKLAKALQVPIDELIDKFSGNESENR